VVKVNALLLKELKNDFYDWCGELSINECVSNPALIEMIERLERLLIRLTHSTEQETAQ